MAGSFRRRVRFPPPPSGATRLRLASLGGRFEEETFQAWLRAGRCALAAGAPSGQLQELWLRAHALQPDRPEPLYELARHWLEDRQSPAVAFVYAQRAAQPPPFRRMPSFRWIPSSTDERLLENLALYQERWPR